MRVVRHLATGRAAFRSPVVALGNFDGVHLGHKAILERTLGGAERAGTDAVVFTFMPHPVAVLAPDRAPKLVTSLAQRLRFLRDAGVDGVFVQRFTRRFAALSPREFVERVLIEGLGASRVVAGYDVTFGKGRAGTPEVLRELGRELGVEVDIVEPLLLGEHKISSSATRRALADGDVELAAELLGRRHRVLGRVRLGDQRGATIGFPTANILPRGGLLPPDGVYAVRARLAGEDAWRPAVANLGTNPTFGGCGRRLETHVFDFAGDLYGRAMEVEFARRLRGEVKFPSVDALVEQIAADAAAAREFLAGPS